MEENSSRELFSEKSTLQTTEKIQFSERPVTETTLVTEKPFVITESSTKSRSTVISTSANPSDFGLDEGNTRLPNETPTTAARALVDKCIALDGSLDITILNPQQP